MDSLWWWLIPGLAIGLPLAIAIDKIIGLLKDILRELERISAKISN